MKAGLILCAFLLTACCTQPAPVASEPAAEASLRIGPEGIIGLEGKVPFTLQAIERAFAGFEVVAAADAQQPVFHVREPSSEETLFIVTPDWTRGYVGSVSANLPGQSGTLEILVGVTPYSELRNTLPQPCAGEPDLRDGPVSCDIALSAGTLRLDFPASRADPVLKQIAYFPGAARP